MQEWPRLSELLRPPWHGYWWWCHLVHLEEWRKIITCKMIEEGTVGDLRDYISNITPKFLAHCYVKRQQAANYSKVTSSRCFKGSPASRILGKLHLRTSRQNTKCSLETAPSKFVHRAARRHSGKLHSKVVASDNLTHSKETLVAYVSRLLDDIPATVKSVSIWSDGPSSQFKNRYIAVSQGEAWDQDSVELFLQFLMERILLMALGDLSTSCVDSCEDQEGHREWCRIICAGLQCTWINSWGLHTSHRGMRRPFHGIRFVADRTFRDLFLSQKLFLGIF